MPSWLTGNANVLSSVETVLVHSVGPRSYECDNKEPKKFNSLLNFASNTELGTKKNRLDDQ